MSNIDTLRKQLAQAGVLPQHKAYQKALERAQQRASEALAQTSGIVRNPVISRRVQRLLGYVSVGFTALFLVCGVALVLLLFPITEGVAARAGMLAFGTDPLLATLTAVALVIGTIVSMVTTLVAGGYRQRPPLTFGVLVRRWHVMTGQEQPQIVTPAEVRRRRMVNTTLLLEVSIVLLAFFGRSISFVNSAVNWRQFLIEDLLLNSTAVEFIGAIASALVTYTMLRMTSVVVAFVYALFTAQAGTIEMEEDETKKAAALEAAIERELADLLLAAQTRAARDAERLEQQDTQ